MAEINFSIGNAELLIKDWNRRTNSMKRHFNCQMNPKYFHLRIIVRSLNRICNYAIFFQRNSSNQEVRYFPYSANNLLESSWRTTTTTGDLRWADGKPIFINLNRNKNLSFFFVARNVKDAISPYSDKMHCIIVICLIYFDAQLVHRDM